MKKFKILLTAFAIWFTTIPAIADEGMWLLSLLEGYTIEDMQSKGFKLTAEDIYSVNQACLKDAVVIFGGGCTGEMISGNGLVMTNHHCGYGAIQRLSSVENDYLSDGFWAMSLDEELPNERLSVQFMRYMEEVTEKALDGVGEDDAKEVQEQKIGENIQSIIEKAQEDGKYEASVRSMFYGNQYFLFVYERFNDVRLVGAPPSSIGNFGEDNDNWMWPRHTGDFSLFRVYADRDNNPAPYSPENVPYKPAKFFEISMDGVNEGDFTMILGYPGSTQQFLHSEAIKHMMETILPLSIDLRTQRLEIMDRYMKQSDKVRIQYASKYRGVSNAWKKWQGAIKGLIRLDAVERKVQFEEEFSQWVAEDPDRQEAYGDILPGLEEIYGQLTELDLINELMREAVFAVEVFRISSSVYSYMADTLPAEEIRDRISRLYKDYHTPIDREIFAAMMENYRIHSPSAYHPAFFTEVVQKFKGDFTAFTEELFEDTPFSSEEALLDLVAVYEKKPAKAMKKLEKDPLLDILEQYRTIYRSKVMPQLMLFDNNLAQLYKKWVQARFEFQPEKRFYPDANFTMRLTYGEVEGYYPEDAVEYDFYTTLSGVMEKNMEDQPDYVIPDALRDLYEAKDFGPYGIDSTATMPVCFTASNHTSGGNSGSPVIDANGRLIGINFDRNWHGTMSDEMYDPEMCRNIAVDIRYILFIIDKFAGAGYLLDEMVLVNE